MQNFLKIKITIFSYILRDIVVSFDFNSALVGDSVILALTVINYWQYFL